MFWDVRFGREIGLELLHPGKNPGRYWEHQPEIHRYVHQFHTAAHEEDGFGRGPSHDFDENVNRGLSVFDQAEHRQEELSLLGKDLGEFFGGRAATDCRRDQRSGNLRTSTAAPVQGTLL